MVEGLTPTTDETSGGKLGFSDPIKDDKKDRDTETQGRAADHSSQGITPEQIEEKRQADEVRMAELREQLGVANSSSETARTEQGISESETRLDLAEEERSEVLRIEQELKSAFETEYAGKLEEFLAGDALQRAKADAYLFGRAVAETDPSQRRLSTLAHLDLDLKYNQPGELHRPYQTASRPTQFEYEGMLNSGTELVKGSAGEKLRVDTEQLQEAFIDFTEKYLKAIEFNKDRVPTGGLTNEQLCVAGAAWRETLDYFGHPNEDTIVRARASYEDRTPSLSEFKGKSSSVCTEGSALAQQLIAFAGVYSRLISGQEMMEANERGELEHSSLDGHVFNEFFTRQSDGSWNAFILDVVNPLYVKEGDSIRQRLYLAPLTGDQFNDFSTKGLVWVKHEGTTRAYRH